MVFVNTGTKWGGQCASANDAVWRERRLREAPCCCLTLLAGRSCVIKRFELPAALLRNFSLEASLAHPPNPRRPQMDIAPFAWSFITFCLPKGAVSGFIFNLKTVTGCFIKCWLHCMFDLILHFQIISWVKHVYVGYIAWRIFAHLQSTKLILIM